MCPASERIVVAAIPRPSAIPSNSRNPRRRLRKFGWSRDTSTHTPRSLSSSSSGSSIEPSSTMLVAEAKQISSSSAATPSVRFANHRDSADSTTLPGEFQPSMSDGTTSPHACRDLAASSQQRLRWLFCSTGISRSSTGNLIQEWADPTASDLIGRRLILLRSIDHGFQNACASVDLLKWDRRRGTGIFRTRCPLDHFHR